MSVWRTIRINESYLRHLSGHTPIRAGKPAKLLSLMRGCGALGVDHELSPTHSAILHSLSTVQVSGPLDIRRTVLATLLL